MTNQTRRGALVVGLAAFVALASGCATTKPMALSKETQAVALDAQQSLALATVKVANVYKTGYQPHVRNVAVKSTGEKEESFAFTVATPYRASEVETDQYEEFLLSLALAPGTYELTGIRVTAGGFPVMGNGVVPINSTFQVAPGKAVYLGRIEAVRRERTGDEPRAGSVIPLLDQAVTGFSGSTFDVKLFDGYDHDLPLMRAEYPALKNVTVEKQFLKPKPPAPPAPKQAEDQQ